MKMTERNGSSCGNGSGIGSSGSNRKHKKYKNCTTTVASTVTYSPCTSKSVNNVINNNTNISIGNSLSTNTALTTTESSLFSANGEQSTLTEISSTKPLKLVLKVGQSGAYSPASSSSATFLSNNVNNIDQTIISGECVNDLIVNSRLMTIPQPPELLPLTVDSYHHNVDFTQINLLKKSKKKKKKHHHHHHHHHHRHSSPTKNLSENVASNSIKNDNDDSNSYQANIVNNVNNSLSSSSSSAILLNRSNMKQYSTMDVDDDFSECSAFLQNQQKKRLVVDEKAQINESLSKSISVTNDIGSECVVDDDVADDVMLMNQDSIFSSVDLIDVDSCSKLDISALVPEGDDELNVDNENSRQSAVSSIISNLINDGQIKRKLRPTTSIYRQLLQKGQVSCDSNNLYEHLRRKEKISLNTSLKKCTVINDSLKRKLIFQQFLMSLLKRLQIKDSHQLFAWPVIDSLTPGYSQIVEHPIDFYTICKKIEHNIYQSVAELKFDVRLLCENAIRYYRHSGIHYKEASRLWYYAKTKVFARDQLAEHVKQFPPLTMSDLGMDEITNSIGAQPNLQQNCPSLNGNQDFSNQSDFTLNSLLNDTPSLNLSTNYQHLDENESKFILKDELTINSDQILDETYNMLRFFRSEQGYSNSLSKDDIPKLTLNHLSEESALTMLRQTTDGTTTLPFVLPSQYDNSNYYQNKNSQTITLGNLVGTLSDGSMALSPYQEPSSERIKPFCYNDESLMNAFSSHLPYMDSSSSTINHQETALLFETFEKLKSTENYNEIENIANDGSYLMKSFVDSLLSIVSNGEYKPNFIDSKKTFTINTNDLTMKHEPSSDLQSIIQSKENPDTSDIVQKHLNETKDMLQQLESIQTQRLTKSTEALAPSTGETEMADKVTTSLVDIIKRWFHPADIIEPQTIRKQLGITIKTESSSPTNSE